MRDLLTKAGSPVVTLGLTTALAAWSAILAVTGSVSVGWEAFDLVSFRIFVVLLLVNLGIAASQSLRRPRKLTCLFLYLAALFVLLSGAYSYLFRFEGTVGLAEGESYEPIPPMYMKVKRGPLAGIPALAFTLTRVNPDQKMGRVVVVQRGMGREIGSEWEKIGSSEIRFVKSSLAPLVVVTSEKKGELERSYVKLDLDRTGKSDSFAFDTLPYDFYLWKEDPKGRHKADFWLNVRRGKLGLFDGPVTVGQKVSVQSVEVRIEEPRKYAVMEIRCRRGFNVFLASLGVLAAAVVTGLVTKLKSKSCSQG